MADLNKVSSAPLRILIVDDHTIVRDGLRQIWPELLPIGDVAKMRSKRTTKDLPQSIANDGVVIHNQDPQGAEETLLRSAMNL